MLSAHIPPLEALQLLLVVSRTGSLNLAAAELGVSQQAASARISSMEAQSGVVLLARTARGSRLTPAGVMIAEWAARLLDVAAELDAGIASLRQDQATKLRVSASMTIAEQLLPTWLVTLAADAARSHRPTPQIELRATNSESVAADVLGGSADLGFIEGPTIARGLRSRTVGRDRLVVVARSDHPWARRRGPVQPEEIARTPFVTREQGSGTREAFEQALRASVGAGIEPAVPVLTLSTSAAVRAAVAAGAGPAVLSELAVAGDLDAGRLREIDVAGLSLSRLLRAVWLGAAVPPAGSARDLVSVALTK